MGLMCALSHVLSKLLDKILLEILIMKFEGRLTLSSIVSNLVSKIPSINLGLGVVERSANFCNRNRSEAQITPNYRILIEQIIFKKETKKSLRNNR